MLSYKGYFLWSLYEMIFLQAVMSPAELIANKEGVEGDVVAEKILTSDWETGIMQWQTHENILNTGVIDPTKVVRCALHNAASVAGMVLTTQAIVIEKPKKSKSATPAPGVAI